MSASSGSIDGIRAQEPDAAFRSSFIVGFPGETEAAHEALLGFLDAAQLDWAGFFPFSAEDGTPAATMDGAVDPDDRRRAAARVRGGPGADHPGRRATRSSAPAPRSRCSSTASTPTPATPVGRTHREAPEIDGVVRLDRRRAPARACVVRAQAVTDALGPDLVAEPIEVLA